MTTVGEILVALKADPRNVHVPESVLRGFALAKYRASQRWPYALGGGHDPSRPFQPSRDIRPEFTHVIGYDCSGVASDVAKSFIPVSHAMGTEELQHVGDTGQGRYATLWDIHQPHVIEHCAIEFKIPSDIEHRWFMAAHTGSIVGFFPLGDHWMEPFNYTARRRPA